MDAFFALNDPAIVWDASALPSPAAGIYRGHDRIREFLREWRELFEVFQVHAETFVDAGDGVVVGHRLSGRGKTSGARVEMPRWHVYRIEAGLVVRVDVFATEDEVLRAAGMRT